MATAKKKADVVAGVKIGKVDKDRVAEIARTVGVEPKGIVETVTALMARFEGLSDDESWTCDHCDGTNPNELNNCAFCGLSAEEANESEAASSPSASLALVPRKEAAKGSGSLLTGGGGVVDGCLVSPGEIQLDQAVVRINTAKRGTAASYWALGREILSVNEDHSWQHRTREGKPLYKSFEDFRKHELRLPKTTVYAMMRAAKNYQIADIERYGTTRLDLLLSVPKTKQDQFAQFVKSGGKDGDPASLRKARQKVRELNANRKDKVGAKTQPREGELTLAVVFGKKHAIPLFQPPKAKEGAKLVAAKKIEDQPWGHLDLKNGKRLVFRLATFPTGQLKLLCEIREGE